jgi:predicted transcriptional regulator
VTRRNEPGHAVTALQQAILDFLWTTGPSAAEQVRIGLDPKHPLKDSTVRTLLRRLEARGLVVHDVDGKVFVYRAALPRERVAAGAVKHVVRRFFAGSVEQLLVGMVDEKLVSAEELERLARKVRRSRG